MSAFFPFDPKEFEQLCTRLLWYMGFRDIVRIGGSGDKGLDIICFDEYGNKFGIQCKRYLNRKVTPREIREFIGALSLYRCNRGIFMTTSTLTREAWEAVRIQGNITVFDGPKLRRAIELFLGSYPDSGELIVYDGPERDLADIFAIIFLFGFLGFIVWLISKLKIS